jgi:hypothetical protein
MPSVYVRCFSSPLPEWRRARHVLDHCRAIHAVLTADVTPILPEAAVRPELLPIYHVSARHEVTNLAIAELILQFLGSLGRRLALSLVTMLARTPSAGRLGTAGGIASEVTRSALRLELLN